MYRAINEGLYQKALCPAGVKFFFRTDSKTLKLKIKTESIPALRQYFAVDVVVDDTLLGSLDNFSHMEMPRDYVKTANLQSVLRFQTA